MLVKKEMLENLASRPFVGLCATFASRKRKTRTLPSSRNCFIIIFLHNATHALRCVVLKKNWLHGLRLFSFFLFFFFLFSPLAFSFLVLGIKIIKI